MIFRVWRWRWPWQISTQTLLARADRCYADGDGPGAVRALAAAARRDEPEACMRLARAYLDGHGVPRSVTEGMRWLERGAVLGHVPAQALFAALLLRGVDFLAAEDAGALFRRAGQDVSETAAADISPARFTQAREWAEKAAAAGSADGRAVLAYILSNGPEETRDPDQAGELYRLAAEGGSPQGALGHALALASDAPDAARQKAILAWLERAATGGLTTARYLLGELHERGLAGEVDLATAAAHYSQAASMGHRNAQARYGLALLRGRGVERDPVGGESWLRRAALAGDAEAAALVGDLYARAEGAEGGTLPPNYLEAALWYERAANAGHGAAARALGFLYLTGAGVGRDPAEAARWFRLAGERGDTEARTDLGNLVLREGGSEADQTRSREWFEEAAEQGDATAAYNFGICLLEGVGTERDPAQAARWLLMAAETLPRAQFVYGRLLAQGDNGQGDNGVNANPVAARVWIGKAAQAGLAEAQALLGSMLINGEGGPKDHSTAQVWFAHAAASGHAGAMFALGAMAGGGHDVPVDHELARNWYRAAAEKGHAHAQLMLGRFLARGLAGPVDPEAAREWLEKARAQGMTEAEADLAALRVAGSVA